ncbi:MAG: HAD family hydrolase [Bacilli bacterium]|nr:HAD family hydrolase [Bacilli bacterium]MDD4076721.1 HAD family hydrolase [Bacilli bacterium]
MNKDFLIAIDLDGTVVTDFDKYDYKSLRYLKKISRNNIIVIATGRPYRSTKPIYEMLEINTPIINYNGAMVHNPNDYLFPKSTITISKDVIIDLLKEKGDAIINVFCEVEDEIYLWKKDDQIKPYLHADGGTLLIGNPEEILNNDPNGAIIYAEAKWQQTLYDYITAKYNNEVHLRFWPLANDFVLGEVYNAKTSKGQALKKIAHYYRIPDKKIIAFGDGHNDIDLLQAATISVAMANSHPKLFAVAKYITKSVQKHGVYYFLKKYFHKL